MSQVNCPVAGISRDRKEKFKFLEGRLILAPSMRSFVKGLTAELNYSEVVEKKEGTHNALFHEVISENRYLSHNQIAERLFQAFDTRRALLNPLVKTVVGVGKEGNHLYAICLFCIGDSWGVTMINPFVPLPDFLKPEPIEYFPN